MYSTVQILKKIVFQWSSKVNETVVSILTRKCHIYFKSFAICFRKGNTPGLFRVSSVDCNVVIQLIFPLDRRRKAIVELIAPPANLVFL